MQLVGVRETAVAEPEPFIETLRVDDQHVPFPFASRVTVVQWIVTIALKRANLRPSVGVDEMPVMVAASGHDKNSPEFFFFEELYSEGQLKLPHRSRRKAREKHRIIFHEIALPVHVEVAGPLLK